MFVSIIGEDRRSNPRTSTKAIEPTSKPGKARRRPSIQDPAAAPHRLGAGARLQIDDHEIVDGEAPVQRGKAARAGEEEVRPDLCCGLGGVGVGWGMIHPPSSYKLKLTHTPLAGRLLPRARGHGRGPAQRRDVRLLRVCHDVRTRW